VRVRTDGCNLHSKSELEISHSSSDIAQYCIVPTVLVRQVDRAAEPVGMWAVERALHWSLEKKTAKQESSGLSLSTEENGDYRFSFVGQQAKLFMLPPISTPKHSHFDVLKAQPKYET
jgi:hypothetical protein